MSYNSNNDTIRSYCSNLFNKELDNDSLSKNIERYIYNHTIIHAKTHHIRRTWDNKIFKELYLSKIRSIYTNISKAIINNQNVSFSKNGRHDPNDCGLILKPQYDTYVMCG